MKHELQGIISGENKISHGAIIQAAACYLNAGPQASRVVKGAKQYKAQETEILKGFIDSNSLWTHNIPFESYISEGAEQKVYLRDKKSVYKLNDSIYYSCWQDYLRSLLLHNYFFSDTAYTLEGFCNLDNQLYAFVSQPYVWATEKTNLETVKLFMENNGFINNRNHDYYNASLGIIAEDLHDENVLTENGVLRFIDTVFYLDESFFNSSDEPITKGINK